MEVVVHEEDDEEEDEDEEELVVWSCWLLGTTVCSTKWLKKNMDGLWVSCEHVDQYLLSYLSSLFVSTRGSPFRRQDTKPTGSNAFSPSLMMGTSLWLVLP